MFKKTLAWVLSVVMLLSMMSGITLMSTADAEDPMTPAHGHIDFTTGEAVANDKISLVTNRGETNASGEIKEFANDGTETYAMTSAAGDGWAFGLDTNTITGSAAIGTTAFVRYYYNTEKNDAAQILTSYIDDPMVNPVAGPWLAVTGDGSWQYMGKPVENQWTWVEMGFGAGYSWANGKAINFGGNNQESIGFAEILVVKTDDKAVFTDWVALEAALAEAKAFADPSAELAAAIADAEAQIALGISGASQYTTAALAALNEAIKNEPVPDFIGWVDYTTWNGEGDAPSDGAMVDVALPTEKACVELEDGTYAAGELSDSWTYWQARLKADAVKDEDGNIITSYDITVDYYDPGTQGATLSFAYKDFAEPGDANKSVVVDKNEEAEEAGWKKITFRVVGAHLENSGHTVWWSCRFVSSNTDCADGYMIKRIEFDPLTGDELGDAAALEALLKGCPDITGFEVLLGEEATAAYNEAVAAASAALTSGKGLVAAQEALEAAIATVRGPSLEDAPAEDVEIRAALDAAIANAEMLSPNADLTAALKVAKALQAAVANATSPLAAAALDVLNAAVEARNVEIKAELTALVEAGQKDTSLFDEETAKPYEDAFTAAVAALAGTDALAINDALNALKSAAAALFGGEFGHITFESSVDDPDVGVEVNNGKINISYKHPAAANIVKDETSYGDEWVMAVNDEKWDWFKVDINGITGGVKTDVAVIVRFHWRPDQLPYNQVWTKWVVSPVEASALNLWGAAGCKYMVAEQSLQNRPDMGNANPDFKGELLSGKYITPGNEWDYAVFTFEGEDAPTSILQFGGGMWGPNLGFSDVYVCRLADKDAMIAKIQMNDLIKEAEGATESAALTAVLESANALKDSETLAPALADVAARLKAALALSALVDEEIADLAEYTEDTAAAYTAAIAAAKATLADAAATADAMNEAAAALAAAAKALDKVADKEALKAYLDGLVDITAIEDLYDAEKVDAYKTALAAVEALLEDNSALQSTVDAAVEALETAKVTLFGNAYGVIDFTDGTETDNDVLKFKEYVTGYLTDCKYNGEYAVECAEESTYFMIDASELVQKYGKEVTFFFRYYMVDDENAAWKSIVVGIHHNADMGQNMYYRANAAENNPDGWQGTLEANKWAWAKISFADLSSSDYEGGATVAVAGYGADLWISAVYACATADADKLEAMFELEALVAEAKVLPESEALTKALAAAEAVLATNCVSEALAAAAEDLAAVVEVASAVAALDEIIEIADAFELGEYTSDVADAFKAALAAAKEVAAKADATVEEMTKATDDLVAATEALEIEMIKVALTDAIADLKAELDLSIYTKESVAKLNAALEALEALIESAEATLEDLEAAAEAVSTAVEALEIGYKLGDVNDDGNIDSTDARLTLQYFVDAIDADDINLQAADVNGDGDVDSTDARLILQYFVEAITEFPTAK